MWAIKTEEDIGGICVIQGLGISDIGKVRQQNEDLFIFEAPYLGAVADGMGGHLGGKEASQLAIEALQEFVHPEISPTSGQIESWLSSIFLKANERIFQQSQKKKDLSGMGTTLSTCYFETETMYWAHVGDSRIYIFREGKLRQITKDHALSNKSGGKSHMLTRALGVEDFVKVDTGVESIFSEDQLLICSDGLYEFIQAEELLEILRSGRSLAEKLRLMIEKAYLHGASDNITAVLIEVKK